jgi:SAM-dependent methyltransferase
MNPPSVSATAAILTGVSGPGSRWNHNIHYHPLILAAVPAGCESALDVGCGEGILARELRQSVPHVTAIDLDEPSLSLGREQDPDGAIDFLAGDFLTHPFTGSFDFIASVAAIHHMDMRRALERMRDLLRPGGTLVVIGLARAKYPADLPVEAAGAVLHRLHKARRGYWEHSAPILWPPPETFASARRLAAEVLPGMRYRRHLLWRYSIVWSKPRPDSAQCLPPRLGVLGQVPDHLNDLAAGVAVAAGDLEQRSCLRQYDAALGRACNGDAPAAAEFQEALVPENVQRSQHGVLVDLQHGGEVAGQR